VTPARRRGAGRGASPPAPPPAPAGPGLPMGRTGVDHPPLGVGLWALGRWDRPDEERTRASVDRALARGLRWFDTAEVYGAGRSERVLGDALAAAPVSGPPPFVVTKVSWEHLRPGQVRAALVGSLHRLGRPAIDLYLVHAPDPRTPIPDTMEALVALRDEGKTRTIGVSNFGLQELDAAREALPVGTLAANQVRFNLLDRDEAAPILDYCRHHGIVVEAYTPLARGILTGRYLDGGAIPEPVREAARPRVDEDRLPQMLRRARALRELAATAGVPLASVALHWLARQGVAPVFGVSRPEQVDQVLAAWAVRPPDDVLDRADEIGRDDG
jgi:aryl-alcohol dehydrogenase-like predicted oxidoreductase